MKKILNIMLALAMTAVYTSCTNEVDDVFSEPSAVRIEKALAEDRKILEGAENGWIMDFYGDTQYGGFTVYLKFNTDSTVTVKNELFDSSVEVTSHYKLEQSAGVVLSFDEYNELFHFFSDPINPAGLGDAGKGMNGDLEFRILSAKENEVIISTGKKHNGRIVMRPAPAGFDAAAYFDRIIAIEEDMDFANYKLTVGENTYDATAAYRCLHVQIPDENGDITELDLPYIVTDEGYKLYEPVTIDGETITGFKYTEDGTNVYPEFSNDKVTFKAFIPPINKQFVDGLWATSLSNFGEFGQLYWTYCKERILPVFNENVVDGTLTNFYFGTNNGTFGATYILCGYLGVNSFDYELIDNDKIKMVYNSTGNNSNGTYFAGKNSAYLASFLLTPFGCNQTGTPTVRTFQVTTNDIKNPTEIILTDINNENNTIRLTQQDINKPFDN